VNRHRTKSLVPGRQGHETGDPVSLKGAAAVFAQGRPVRPEKGTSHWSEKNTKKSFNKSGKKGEHSMKPLDLTGSTCQNKTGGESNPKKGTELLGCAAGHKTSRGESEKKKDVSS